MVEFLGNLPAMIFHETKRLLGIALYFFLLIGLFTVFKAATLGDEHILYHQGFAIINALVLAKVVLLAELAHVAENFKDRPLIYPIVFKSAVFSALLSAFYIAEEVLVGVRHGSTIAESVPEMGGGGWRGTAVVAVILFFGLIPFFFYRELARVLGQDELRSLVFKRGKPAASR